MKKIVIIILVCFVFYFVISKLGKYEDEFILDGYNDEFSLDTGAGIDFSTYSKYYYDKSMDYFEEKFSYDSVISRWEELLHTGEIHYSDKLTNICYRYKWLKELLRIVKRYLPILYHIPMLERILIFIERKRFGRVTYIDS